MTINEKAKQRRIEMARLTHEGWSMQMIADKYGITRQAVSLLLKKAALKDGEIVVKNKSCKILNEKNVIIISNSKKYKKTCKICNKDFVVRSNKKNKKTCSEECFKKLIELRIGGEWSRVNSIILNCDFCKKDFSRIKYFHKLFSMKKTSNKNYCSRNCYNKSRKVKV